MLSLNPSKREMVILGTRQQLGKLRDFQVNVADILCLKNIGSVALGLLVKGFNQNITHVYRAAFSYLHDISRDSQNTFHNYRFLLIQALVLSGIEFCCSVL
jgi:secreted Zn-dependent insulinase-like peptidase